MPPVTRRAELADAPRLGELHSAIWRELYPAVLSPELLDELSPAVMTGLWQRFIARGGDYVQWVAEIGGEIVGFAGTGPGREPGYEEGTELYFIAVHPDHRRAGLGKALIATANPDYLWIHSLNRESQTFYKKMKFRPDSVAREGALFGAPLPEIRMSR